MSDIAPESLGLPPERDQEAQGKAEAVAKSIRAGRRVFIAKMVQIMKGIAYRANMDMTAVLDGLDCTQESDKDNENVQICTAANSNGVMGVIVQIRRDISTPFYDGMLEMNAKDVWMRVDPAIVAITVNVMEPRDRVMFALGIRRGAERPMKRMKTKESAKEMMNKNLEEMCMLIENGTFPFSCAYPTENA